MIAITIGEAWASIWYVMSALLLGFVAYGLSIFFYVHAQRELGASKTSAYYAIALFIGVALLLIIFREIPNINFVLALVIMLAGTYFASTDWKKINNLFIDVPIYICYHIKRILILEGNGHTNYGRH